MRTQHALISTEDGTEIGSVVVALLESERRGIRGWQGAFELPEDIPVGRFDMDRRMRYSIELDDGRSGVFFLRQITESTRSGTTIAFVGTGPLA